MEYKYKKDDYIVYDTYGVCKITDIKQMSLIHGVKAQDYYILSSVNFSGCTYYIPCGNETLLSKMRRPFNADEINALLEASKKIEFSWNDNRQQRCDFSKEIMQKGITPELIALIRCFYERKVFLDKNEKKFSSTDENILTGCEKMINEEFAFSLKLDATAVPTYICEKIESNNQHT